MGQFTTDVIIIGGGPAGSATALALRSFDPSLSVMLVEASSYDTPRIGEFLPSVARDLLNHLGIWEAFQSERHLPSHATSAAWGRSELWENHFIYSMHGPGWHLDRVRFDSFLMQQAKANGVRVLLSTRVVESNRSKGGWLLQLQDGTELRARFVVDATGRSAAFARRMGAHPQIFDRLTGFARFFTLDKGELHGTLVEAFSEGWWYTTLAGECRVVVCLTDNDLAGKLSLTDVNRWLNLLSSTSWIIRSIGDGDLRESLMVRAANSVRLDMVCSNDWLAVGDAASAFDPLSSLGIVKSLRSAIFASYAIADHFSRCDNAGIARYQKFVESEFMNYQRLRTLYYKEERRWPNSRFWQRRHQN
jgi:flavin-dependent dehydrogenase